MTIYHIGTEDIHFVRAGGATVWTGTLNNFFRTDWSRCALQAGRGPFWRAPLQHMSVSTASFWWTCRLAQAASAISSSDWVRFLDGSFWRLAVYGHEGEIPVLLRHNDDDTITTLATGFLPMFALARLGKVDISINLGTGLFRLFLDHELALTFTGDLTGGEYSAITGYDLFGGGFEANALFSEVCWRSDDTRKMIGVRSIWPYGDGSAQDWTGSIADVDEIAVDDNDANYTDTPGLRQQYTTPPLPSGLTGNSIVGAVMLGARMATNTTDEAVNIRTGGNDFESSTFDTARAIEDRMYIWEENPDTTNPWTTDEINDADFNIGVTSI